MLRSQLRLLGALLVLLVERFKYQPVPPGLVTLASSRYLLALQRAVLVVQSQ